MSICRNNNGGGVLFTQISALVVWSHTTYVLCKYEHIHLVLMVFVMKGSESIFHSNIYDVKEQQPPRFPSTLRLMIKEVESVSSLLGESRSICLLLCRFDSPFKYRNFFIFNALYGVQCTMSARLFSELTHNNVCNCDQCLR